LLQGWRFGSGYFEIVAGLFLKSAANIPLLCEGINILSNPFKRGIGNWTKAHLKPKSEISN
jgi:hypothetical protein